MQKAILAAASVIAVIGYAAVAARRLIVDEITVPLNRAPELHGLRILHVSDTHASHPEHWVLASIRLLASVKVDLIAVTGDVITGLEGLAAAAEAFAALESRLGTFVVPGNHDHWTGRHLDRLSGRIAPFVSPQRYADEFDRRGIRVLVNEAVTVATGDGNFNLVGLDDPYLGLSDSDVAFDGVSGDRPTIVLGHSPDGAALLKDRRCELFLCGHTHGGQILGPGGLPPRVTNTIYPLSSTYGLMVHRGVLTHVSAGLGTAVVPLRFNCPPRATILTLTNVE